MDYAPIGAALVSGLFLWIATYLGRAQARGEGRLDATTGRIDDQTSRMEAIERQLGQLHGLVNTLKPADFAAVNVRLESQEEAMHARGKEIQAMHIRHTTRLEKLEAWREDVLQRLGTTEGLVALARADAADAKDRAKSAEDYARGLTSDERLRGG